MAPYDLRLNFAFGKGDEVASFWLKQKNTPHPDGFGVLLELLARFELATRFHEISDFMEALRPHD